jgi:central kinetochore subunit Mis15/CHL4
MAPSRAESLPVIPSTEALSDSIRLSSTHPRVFKTLSVLSRAALLDLATEWSSPEHRPSCGPYINGDLDQEADENCPWTAATTYDELLDLYRDELSARKGSKRELLDRILEGDWRHGVSLKQLAMAESRSVLDNSGARRWTAFEIYNKSLPTKSKKHASSPIKHPKFNPATFIISLHRHISALAKAHYYVSQQEDKSLTLVRVALFDTPYSTSLHINTSVFLIFPTGAPSFVYVSRPSSTASLNLEAETSSLLAFVVKSIGPALSRLGQRWALRPTSLTARSLNTLLAMRGPGRTNSAGGGWSIFADEQQGTEVAAALDLCAATDKTTAVDRIVSAKTKNKDVDETDKENAPPRLRNAKRPFQHAEPTAHLPPSKRTRLQRTAAGRFGVSALPDSESSAPLARFDVSIKDPFPGVSSEATTRNATESTLTSVRIAFSGKDVFAGIRQLAEIGVIDAERMPAWMTGEGNVSFGSVEEGRLRAWSGL